MLLDKNKLHQDEKSSTPLAVAYRYRECPKKKKEICFGIAVGFGTIVGKCKFFNEETFECSKS